MRKRTGWLIGLLAACIALPGLIYLGLAIYYQDSFFYGTWINGIYCTGKTVEQVQAELTRQFTYEGLKVEGKAGEDFLSVEGLELSFDFQPTLRTWLNEQNPFDWLRQIVGGQKDNFLLPQISFQEEKVEEWLKESVVYTPPQRLLQDSLAIVMTEEGYRLEENKADILKFDLAARKIKEAINRAETEINLEKENCYTKREDTPQMLELRRLYEQVEQFQQLSLTYQIKDKSRKVTPLEIARWLKSGGKEAGFVLDEEGRLTIDNKAVEDFIDSLAKEYDTWHNFPFTTHDGRKVVIQKGNYGIQLSRKEEVKFLLELLEAGTDEATVRIPEYTKDITYNNQHQIEGTYIEIDMKEQKLFYFEEGEQKLETDVVTGSIKKGMGTPEMVCYVYNKKENAILKGKGYRSSVNYWVPVYKGIGIHDASWRNTFGGETYLQNGSHGCINTPLEKMEQLYEMIEVGIPVVLHN